MWVLLLAVLLCNSFPRQVWGDDAALAIENHNAMVRAAMLTEEAHTQVHAALAELTHTSAAEDSSARSVVARKSETAAREASSAAAAAAAEATNGVDGADRRRQDQAEAARRVREAKRAVAAEMRREREQARGEVKAQQSKVQSAVAGARSALGDTATLDDQRNAVIHQLTGTLHHDDGGVTTVAELQRMSNSRLLEMHGQISIGARRNAMIAQLAGTIDTDGTSLTIAQLQAMGNAEIEYKFDRIRSSNALAAEQLRSSHGDNPMSRSSTSAGKSISEEAGRKSIIAELVGTPNEDGSTLSLGYLVALNNDELIDTHGQVAAKTRRHAMIAQLAGTLDSKSARFRTRAELLAMGNAELGYKYDHMRAAVALDVQKLQAHVDAQQNAAATAALAGVGGDDATIEAVAESTWKGTAAEVHPEHEVLLVEPTGLHRCLDRHHMTVPLEHPSLSQRAHRNWMQSEAAATAPAWTTPPFIASTTLRQWTCAKWRLSAEGTITSSDRANDPTRTRSCLTRFGNDLGDAVKAMPCEVTAVESQQWATKKFVGEGGKARAQLRTLGSDSERCVVPVDACAGVGQAAQLGDCAESAFLWQVETARDIAQAVRSAPLPPDCQYMKRGPASNRLLAIRQGAAKEGKTSRLWERTHSELYRDFRDAFHPVPTTYLEWLVEFHAGEVPPAGTAMDQDLWRSSKGVAMAIKAQFTVAEKTSNFTLAPGGKRPRKMISLALFVPMPVEGDDQELLFGHRIAIDDLYAKIKSHAPSNLEEAMIKIPGVFGGKGFFKKYCQPLVSGVKWASREMNNPGAQSGWGTIVHLAPSLVWLKPILLATGNCEVHMMAAASIRTAGAFWRWLPFDDTSLDVVLSFDADNMEGGRPLRQPKWTAIAEWMEHSHKGQALLRQYHGAGPDNAAIGCPEMKGKPQSNPRHRKNRAYGKWSCFNHATILANFVGAKPRQLTRSFATMMEGFSLHRALLSTEAYGFATESLPSGSAFRKDQPFLWRDYTQRYEDPRLWPASYEPGPVPSIGAHTLGWGRLLFDYGFDEALMKYAAFYESAMSGSLFTIFSPGIGLPLRAYTDTCSADPSRSSGLECNDKLGRRCSNSAYLDVLFTLAPAGITAPPTLRSNAMVDLQRHASEEGLARMRTSLRLVPCATYPPNWEEGVESSVLCHQERWCVKPNSLSSRWMQLPEGDLDGCMSAKKSSMPLGLRVCLHAGNRPDDWKRKENQGWRQNVVPMTCEGVCSTARPRHPFGEHCLDEFAAEAEMRVCSPQQWYYDRASQHVESLTGRNIALCLTAISAKLGSPKKGRGALRLQNCLPKEHGSAWRQRWFEDPTAVGLALRKPDGTHWCAAAGIPSPASMIDASKMKRECAVEANGGRV